MVTSASPAETMIVTGDDGTNGGNGKVGETGKIACVSCHQTDNTWIDRRSTPNNTSLGANWVIRNASSILNASYYTWLENDGLRDSQWSDSLTDPEDPGSMNGSRLRVAHMMYAKYKDRYNAIFAVPLDPALDPAAPDAARFPPDGKPKGSATAPDGPWEKMAPADQKAVSTIYANFGKAMQAYLRLLVSQNSSFDRYVAISVIVDKPVPELDRRANALMLDGEVIGGIPYHGAPLRGGVRIYLDGRLAMVLKRNALGDVGKLPGATPSWNLGALLAATGLDTATIAAAEVVHRDRRKRVENFDLATFNIAADEGASGKILVAGSKQVVEALQLFSKGKVPGPWTPEPMEKFLDGKVKEPYPEDDDVGISPDAGAIDAGPPPPATK